MTAAGENENIHRNLRKVICRAAGARRWAGHAGSRSGLSGLKDLEDLAALLDLVDLQMPGGISGRGIPPGI
jgi:hypothetical protein